jgi:hypothetical protein
LLTTNEKVLLVKKHQQRQRNNPLTDSEARELLDVADRLGLLGSNHGRYILQAETHVGGYYDNVPHIHVFGEHIPVQNPNFSY